MRARIVLLLLLLVIACRDDAPSPQPPRPRPAPVAAPDGLLAELVVPTPAKLIADAREAAGEAIFMQRTVGGMMAELLGFPIRMAEQVEEALPVVGAARKDGFAVAIRVRSGDRFVEQITRGEDGTFASEADGDFTWLTPRPTARRARVAATIAKHDDSVVVGSSRDAVRALAPYLTRTLAPREPPKLTRIDIRPGALVPLAAALRVPELPAPWQNLVEPEALLSAAREIAGELGAGEATMELGKQALTVEARFAAHDGAAKKRFAARPAMSAAQLLDVPDDVVVSAAWSEDEKARVAEVDARAKSLSALLGDALPAAERKHLTKALLDLAKGRGDEAGIGLRCTGVGLTGFATGSVADEKLLKDGLSSALSVAKHQAVTDRLEKEGLSLETKKTRIEEVPMDLWRLRLSPAKESDNPREPIDMLGGAAGKKFLAAAGMETIDTLQRLHAQDPERLLRRAEPMRQAGERLGTRVWLALLADPQSLYACLQGQPSGTPAAPLALAVGPDGERVRVHLEVARSLLRVAAALE
jgi:hypothetical protein